MHVHVVQDTMHTAGTCTHTFATHALRTCEVYACFSYTWVHAHPLTRTHLSGALSCRCGERHTRTHTPTRTHTHTPAGVDVQLHGLGHAAVVPGARLDQHLLLLATQVARPDLLQREHGTVKMCVCGSESVRAFQHLRHVDGEEENDLNVRV